MVARTTRRRAASLAGVALIVLVLLLGAVPAALAKGPPEKVTISGPGIEGQIEVTDRQTLEAFSFYMFNDLDRKAAVPANPGRGYTITRYTPGENGGALVAWDTLTYYPRKGAPGLVYYDGLDPAIGWTEGQGLWYVARPEGDAAMQKILAAYRHAAGMRALGPRMMRPWQASRLPL